MSIKTSLSAGLAAIQAHANWLDRGSNSVTISFYSGTKPNSIDNAADESLRLVTCTLPTPCFKALSADFIELHQTDVAMIVKSGTTTWARILNGEGVGYLDVSVGDGLTLANPELVVGSTLMVNSFKLRPDI